MLRTGNETCSNCNRTIERKERLWSLVDGGYHCNNCHEILTGKASGIVGDRKRNRADFPYMSHFSYLAGNVVDPQNDVFHNTEDGWKGWESYILKKVNAHYLNTHLTSTICPYCEEYEYDPVNHPEHYKTGGIETISFIRAKLSKDEFIGYCMGNVLKYTTRYKHKNGVEDLNKAKVYLQWSIERMSDDGEQS